MNMPRVHRSLTFSNVVLSTFVWVLDAVYVSSTSAVSLAVERLRSGSSANGVAGAHGVVTVGVGS
jgi:hypothetical protein